MPVAVISLERDAIRKICRTSVRMPLFFVCPAQIPCCIVVLPSFIMAIDAPVISIVA